MNISVLLPLVIVCEGAWLFIKLRAFFVRHPISTLRRALAGEGTRDALASLMLALAGTLGVGNIVGVTVAIAEGGAGSLFWMIVSALLSAVIKYAEVRVSAACGSRCGMMGVLRATKGCMTLAYMYAAAALVLSLIMGSALQGSVIGECSESLFDGSVLWLAIVLSGIVSVAVITGGRGIKRAVAAVIPMSTIIYTILCLTVLVPNAGEIPRVLGESVTSAFNNRGMYGGVLGFLTSAALNRGFSVGLLSNEAGAGTSTLAHTALAGKDAERAGIFGIIEVLFDTVFLCTLTGVTFLLSGEGLSTRGIAPLAKLFSHTAGGFGVPLLFFSVVAFAVSTVLCWYYYGSVAASFLFGKRCTVSFAFSLVFLLSFFFGITERPSWLLPATDIFLLLLTLLTLVAIIKNRDKLTPPNNEKKGRPH